MPFFVSQGVILPKQGSRLVSIPQRNFHTDTVGGGGLALAGADDQADAGAPQGGAGQQICRSGRKGILL